MKNKDNALIFESYVKESLSPDPVKQKYNQIVSQLKDLIDQKKQHLPGISEQDAFDVSVEDLQSQYNDQGDYEAVELLSHISAKGGLQEADSGSDQSIDEEMSGEELQLNHAINSIINYIASDSAEYSSVENNLMELRDMLR
jgi:hypothetical protein